MNEEKNNNQEPCCSFCKRGKMMCGSQSGMHMHKGCHIIRWVLAILILWAVFMGGVKIGELKSLLGNEGFRGSRYMYGSQMMGDRYGSRYENRFQNNQNQIYLPGRQMMNQQQIQETPINQ